MSQDVVSFVLRFVREASEDQNARWRGSVKHVQGSTERQFSQFSDALAFMQAHMNEVVEGAAQDSAKLAQINPWLETAKIWGEFVPAYNQFVLDKVSEAVDKGATLPRQFGEALSAAWGVQAPGEKVEGDRLEAKVERLSEQIATLTEVIDTLHAKITSLEAQEAKDF